MSLRSIIRGLSLLRFPSLVQDLGERRFHLEVIEDIIRRNPGSLVSTDVRLVGYSVERLKIGRGSRICQGNVLAFGDQKSGFGRILIGDGTWIGDYNNLRAGWGDIVIGDHCLISQFCTLVAGNHGSSRDVLIKDQPLPEDRRGVELGNDVWLGAGVTITAGVKIGSGAIIGAGAVVTKSVGEYEIWCGVPARKTGDRHSAGV